MKRKLGQVRIISLGTNIDEASKVLKVGYDIASKHGLCWVSAGTALGLVRNGGLIPHDTDLDIEMEAKSFSEELIDDFEAAQFEPILIRKKHDGTPIQLAFAGHPGRFVFDIYFYIKKGHDYINYGAPHKEMWIPASMIDNMDVLYYRGDSYNIPGPYADYLEHRFGPDWQTPTTSKSGWTTEAANLRPLSPHD